jgi:hypothetical protein
VNIISLDLSRLNLIEIEAEVILFCTAKVSERTFLMAKGHQNVEII